MDGTCSSPSRNTLEVQFNRDLQNIQNDEFETFRRRLSAGSCRLGAVEQPAALWRICATACRICAVFMGMRAYIPLSIGRALLRCTLHRMRVCYLFLYFSYSLSILNLYFFIYIFRRTRWLLLLLLLIFHFDRSSSSSTNAISYFKQFNFSFLLSFLTTSIFNLIFYLIFFRRLLYYLKTNSSCYMDTFQCFSSMF